MAMRMLSAVGAIAITLSGCAGYQSSTTPGAQIASVCGTAPGYITSTQIVCGSEPPRAPPVQMAAAVPPPPPPPQRTTAIEYIEGQPMVRIGVPGVSFRCVLDTGASEFVLPFWMVKRIHEQYGLEYRYDGVSQAQLANGNVAAFARITLREISIGPWKLTNVPAAVSLGTMTGDCLLGMSVLKAFGHPMIDFANQRLVLED